MADATPSTTAPAPDYALKPPGSSFDAVLVLLRARLGTVEEVAHLAEAGARARGNAVEGAAFSTLIDLIGDAAAALENDLCKLAEDELRAAAPFAAAPGVAAPLGPETAASLRHHGRMLEADGSMDELAGAIGALTIARQAIGRLPAFDKPGLRQHEIEEIKRAWHAMTWTAAQVDSIARMAFEHFDAALEGA